MRCRTILSVVDVESYNIFISWSGRLSSEVAAALNFVLRRLIQAARPWMSSSSIDPGARWSAELAQALRELQFGIVCLTPDNVNEPWDPL